MAAAATPPIPAHLVLSKTFFFIGNQYISLFFSGLIMCISCLFFMIFFLENVILRAHSLIVYFDIPGHCFETGSPKGAFQPQQKRISRKPCFVLWEKRRIFANFPGPCLTSVEGIFIPSELQTKRAWHSSGVDIFLSGFLQVKIMGHLQSSNPIYPMNNLMPVFVILRWFLPSSKDVSTTIFFENRKIHLNLVDEFFTPRFHDQPLSDLEAHRFHLLTIFPPAKDEEFVSDFYHEHNQHIFFWKGIYFFGLQCISCFLKGLW